jgi:tripartite ATP-independent transporter DctM subunit
MSLVLIVLIVSFVTLLAVNVPVAFAIGISTMLGILATGELPAFLLVAQRMATGIDNFTLLAIPFFILAGLLMGHGGIAQRLIDLAEVVVGRFRGGLAYVTVLTCMLFGSVSGSAAAAVSSVGGFMVPVMNRRYTDPAFNASVIVTASTTGLLIPPSNIMIVYAAATGGAVSIAAMFFAGIVPGLLVGLALMIVSSRGPLTGNSGVTTLGLRDAFVRLGRAFPALIMVVIVLGGIMFGIFTATEASAVAVIYALILSIGLYREVSLRDLPALLLRCAVITSVVLLLVATSTAMAWLLAYENIPQVLSAYLLGLSDNPLVILLIINLIMLAVGTVIDMTPAVLLFTPIFWPVILSLGIDPLHFGVMLIMNLCIGLCTPPVGTCLFLGCSVANTTVARMLPRLIPFYLAMILVLMVVTYLPLVSVALPRWLGVS